MASPRIHTVQDPSYFPEAKATHPSHKDTNNESSEAIGRRQHFTYFFAHKQGVMHEQLELAEKWSMSVSNDTGQG